MSLTAFKGLATMIADAVESGRPKWVASEVFVEDRWERIMFLVGPGIPMFVTMPIDAPTDIVDRT